MKYEENPFENKKVAQEWINCVENEKDLFKDKAIYPLLSKWFSKNKSALVVDIGCGQGICATKIDLKKGKYIGIEPSEILVRRAKKLYKAENIKFVIGSAYALPVHNEIANCVFSVMVWFHLKNLGKAAKELARVLKTKGKFLIITANPARYDSWEGSYFDYIKDAKKIVGKVKVPINPMSKSIFYLHDKSEIQESLIHNGLKISSIRQFGDFGRGKLFIVISGYKK